ncbi:MAG: CotH kinase family protein [Flavobacteriia bacterium]|jgi:hypothetical protein
MRKLFTSILFILTVTLLQSQVELSEISISNLNTVEDEDNSFEDWFEIRNLGPNPINIENYGISDDPTVPFKWLCPNYTLASGEHKLIFASGKDRKPIIDHYESIILANETWNYIVPTAEPESTWKLAGSPLNGWSAGAGGFGYGDGDDATETVPSTSVYLRKSFNINSLSDLKKLFLFMDFDDGFVAYINGVEIARINLGNIGDQIPFDFLATGDHEANAYQGLTIDRFEIDLQQLSDLLVVGENVLAIQVHNVDGNSSDLTSNAFLVAGFTTSNITYSAVLPWMNLDVSNVWHSNFNLSVGEQLLFTNSSGTSVGQVTIPLLPIDNSYNFSSNSWCFSTNPSPGNINSTDCFSTFLNKPTFSKPAGIYASAFKIALSSIDPNAEIRYTVNGDIPTINSPLYIDSILIDETKVIAARCFDPANLALTSLVEKNTYLINESYIGLPVISISTDSLNLYDTLIGIYVHGPNDYSPDFPYFGSNFWEDWERYSYIEYLATDSTQKFEGAIGLKIHGGWSRAFPQKSFRIKCRDDYGMNKINYPLIADKPYITKYKEFNLRNGGNDYNGCRMSDAFMQRLTKKTHTDYMGYTPVIVFLNGEYFGEYELRETLNKDYVENNHDVPAENASVLTENYLVGLNANDGTLDNFWPMYNAITTSDPTSSTFFALADSLIDLENFSDYMITETYYGNGDWSSGYANNIKYWHTPGGKWRMLLMDLDFGYGAYGTSTEDDFIGLATNDAFIHMDVIFAQLLQNQEFLNYFINRYADLINTIWQQNNVQNTGNAMLNELAPWIPRHHATWGGNMTDFQNKMINMQNWNQARISGARNVVQNHFSLLGQVNFSLDVQPAGAGRIHISTIEPSEMEYPWSGVYFNGVPVKITAIPNPGYTFNYWAPNALFSSNNTNAELLITPSIATSFTAWFTGNSNLNAIEISEIMVNAENSRDSDDWIELHNKLDVELNISGMSLSDSSYFNKFIFPLNTKIPANGYLVVAKDTSLFKMQYPSINNVIGPLGFSFNGISETIFLKNHLNNELLHVSYTTSHPWPLGTDGDGRTLEFKGLFYSPNDPSGWYSGCIGGSPGGPYMPCDSSLIISEINYKSSLISNSGDWFEIHSLSNEALDISNWRITDGGNNVDYFIPNGTILDPNEYLVFASTMTLFSNIHPNVTGVFGPTNIAFGTTESIQIFDATNRLAYSVNYTNQEPWPLEADGFGKTMELLSSTENMCSGLNWFAGCPDGSPGAIYNPQCDLSLTENQSNRVLFYPNPVADKLYFTLNENTTVRLYSITGELLKEEKYAAGKIEMNLSDLADGMYLISVLGNTYQVLKN